MDVKFKVFEAPDVAKFQFTDSHHVFDVMKPYGKANREMFLVLHMDAKNRMILKETHSIGTVSCTAIYPREIARSAILNNSSSVILIHNHPSGDPTPSGNDKTETQRIIKALYLFDIKVLDHIILGRDTYYSFSDQGFIEEFELLLEGKQ